MLKAAAFYDGDEGNKLAEIVAEYEKKGRFFFTIECSFIMDRLVSEICIFPEVKGVV